MHKKTIISKPSVSKPAPKKKTVMKAKQTGKKKTIAGMASGSTK